MKKKTIFLVIILVLVSYFLYSNKNSVIEQQGGYEIYKNEEYNFSFKYPSTWSISKSNNGPVEIIHVRKGEGGVFYSVGEFSYINIWLGGRPGSGGPIVPISSRTIESLGSKIENPTSVLELENGEIASMSINFTEEFSRGNVLSIYAGIKTNNWKYACIDIDTQKDLPENHCEMYAAIDLAPGQELGQYVVSGELDKQDEKELYDILSSFEFFN